MDTNLNEKVQVSKMDQAITSSVETIQDEEYNQFSAAVKESFLRYSDYPLFVTNVDLFDVYLNNIPEQYRQHYNCHCCRQFLDRFGSLVSVNDEGRLVPVMWEFSVEGMFAGVVKAIKHALLRAKIVDTFQGGGLTVFGTPVTGEWNHLSAVSRQAIKGVSRREDYITVKRAIAEFSDAILDRALVLLRAETLYRGEKVLGQAEWLRSLHGIPDNLVWRAVSKAPEGFCHPRASMIGTLLEDLNSGLSVEDAGRKFAAKMHPLQYLRPSTLPSDQSIKQAEEVIAKLQAAGSLARRYLRPDEVKSIWTPRVETKKKSDGVFGDLLSGSNKESAKAGSPVSITWEKFRRTVLPTAEKISYYSQAASNWNHPFTALVTAVNADSPPIVQWDSEDIRNPVSWYVYQGGSSLQSFGLSGVLHKVSAVALQPNQWVDEDKFGHQGCGAVFVIEGCGDTRNESLALFPEILRSEFHGVRKVIEAYSGNNKIQGIGEPMAAGILVQKRPGAQWNEHFFVESMGQKVLYKLDRWD